MLSHPVQQARELPGVKGSLQNNTVGELWSIPEDAVEGLAHCLQGVVLCLELALSAVLSFSQAD